VSCDRYILAGLEADTADALTRQRPFQTTRSGLLRRAERRTALQSPLDARRRFALARIGSRSLGEFPLEVVPSTASAMVEPEVMAGTGWWRGSARSPPYPDLLMTLATCELRRDFSRACGARFTDLAAKRE